MPSCPDAKRKAHSRAREQYAEVIRKGKEKRALLNEQSEQRAQVKEESIQREEANRVDEVFSDIKDLEV